MADIFNEIDEQIRKDQFKQLWQRYGILTSGVLLAVLIIVCAYTAWQWWQRSQAEQAAAPLAGIITALSSDQENAQNQELANQLEVFSNQGTTGFNQMAGQLAANLYVEAESWETAQSLYENLSEKENGDQFYQDQARLVALELALRNPNAAFDDLETELNTLIQNLNQRTPVLAQYAELLKVELALAQGQKLQAINLLSMLKDAPDTQTDIKQFASRLITELDAGSASE